MRTLSKMTGKKSALANGAGRVGIRCNSNAVC